MKNIFQNEKVKNRPTQLSTSVNEIHSNNGVSQIMQGNNIAPPPKISKSRNNTMVNFGTLGNFNSRVSPSNQKV